MALPPGFEDEVADLPGFDDPPKNTNNQQQSAAMAAPNPATAAPGFQAGGAAAAPPPAQGYGAPYQQQQHGYQQQPHHHHHHHGGGYQHHHHQQQQQYYPQQGGYQHHHHHQQQQRNYYPGYQQHHHHHQQGYHHHHHHGGGGNFQPRGEVRKPQSNTVWLGYLEPHHDDAFLRPVFERFGRIMRLDILPAKNYGFIHYRSVPEAVAAVDELQKTRELGGARISFGKMHTFTDDGKITGEAVTEGMMIKPRDMREKEIREAQEREKNAQNSRINELNAMLNPLAAQDDQQQQQQGGDQQQQQHMHQQHQQNAEIPTHVLYVGSVPMPVSDQELNRYFGRFSGFRTVTRNFAKECAFVHFDTVDACSEALGEARKQPLIEGYRVKMAFGKPREAPMPQAGRRVRDDENLPYRNNEGADGGAGGDDAGPINLNLPQQPRVEIASSYPNPMLNQVAVVPEGGKAGAAQTAAAKPAYVTRNRSDLYLTLEQKVKGLASVSYFYCGVPPPHLKAPNLMALVKVIDETTTSKGADSRHPLVLELEDAAANLVLPHALAVVAKRLSEHFSRDHNKRLHVFYLCCAALFKIDAVLSTAFAIGGAVAAKKEQAVTDAVLEHLAWLAAVVVPNQDDAGVGHMKQIVENMRVTMKCSDLDEVSFELLTLVLSQTTAKADVSNLLKRLGGGKK